VHAGDVDPDFRADEARTAAEEQIRSGIFDAGATAASIARVQKVHKLLEASSRGAVHNVTLPYDAMKTEHLISMNAIASPHEREAFERLGTKNARRSDFFGRLIRPDDYFERGFADPLTISYVSLLRGRSKESS
jgi:hypothetical protein